MSKTLKQRVNQLAEDLQWAKANNDKVSHVKLVRYIDDLFIFVKEIATVVENNADILRSVALTMNAIATKTGITEKDIHDVLEKAIMEHLEGKSAESGKRPDGDSSGERKREVLNVSQYGTDSGDDAGPEKVSSEPEAGNPNAGDSKT